MYISKLKKHEIYATCNLQAKRSSFDQEA